MTGVGERIRSIRGHRTQKAFAESLGISTQAVINYERHGRIPKQQVLNKISNVYGINVDWLLTGTGAMSLQGGPEVTGAGLAKKMADASPTSQTQEMADGEQTCDMSQVPPLIAAGQSPDIIASVPSRPCDMSQVLGNLTLHSMRLADENAALLRENGDLRVEVERLRHQLSQAKETGPADDALLAKLVQENKDLRARLKAFERAGIGVPPITDIAQNGLPDRG